VSQASAFDVKEQVRQATDIVDLIGASLTLRREGRQYRGTCPWHDDTRPSLQVNPERQSWKCWVCDIGGDIFSFVMKRDGLTFPEALEFLADRAGVTHQRHGNAKHHNQKKQLYRVAAWAEEVYHRTLLEDPAGAPARDYLQERKMSDEMIRRFRLGFAPDDWSWLLRKAERDSIPINELSALGLVATSSRTGKPYDRFKGRVLFSIRDAQQRPIAMGGRILPQWAEQNPAKYINSPESPLFSKSQSLYALDIAKDHKTPSGETRSMIVMEGYTDCLAAHEYGFTNCVACLGTALTEQHVQLLSRYADRITLVLDGDAAGLAAADRALNLFLSGGLELRILSLPKGLDPCDYLQESGQEAFADLLRTAPDALEHKINITTRGKTPKIGTHQAATALEDILATMARAPSLQKGGDTKHKLREEAILARIARDFHVPDDSIRTRLRELRSQNEGVRSSTATQIDQIAHDQPIQIRDPWEQELLEILLQEPEAVLKCTESVSPDELRDPVAQLIYRQAVALAEEGTTPDFSQLITAFDNPSMKNLLATLDDRGLARGGSELAKQLPDLLASFHARTEQSAQRDRITTMRGGEIAEERKLEMLTEIIANEKKRYGRPPH